MPDTLKDVLGLYGFSPYIEWKFVDRWKPLGLPEDVNERVLAEIEKWFEENAL